MTIDARTKVYGVIGFPVGHSLSPVMQNAAFAAIGWNAVYLAFNVPPHRLKSAVEGMRALGIQGLNVTIPHKEAIVPMLDRVAPDAKLVGAVNTVVRERDGRLGGYNTDVPGFFASLRHHVKWDPRGKAAALLGSGGAAKAVAVALAKAGIRSLTVYGRTPQKTEELAKRLGEHFRQVRVQVVTQAAQLQLPKCDLLVNATPIGMQPQDALLIDPRQVHRRLIVYDLIYTPHETRLLQEAKRHGAPAFNGLDVLVRQGVESFKLWTHARMDVEPVMRQALEPFLRQVSAPPARPPVEPPRHPAIGPTPRAPRPIAGAPPRPARPKGGGDEIDITTQAGRLKLMELSYGHEAPAERKPPPQPRRRPPR